MRSALLIFIATVSVALAQTGSSNQILPAQGVFIEVAITDEDGRPNANRDDIVRAAVGLGARPRHQLSGLGALYVYLELPSTNKEERNAIVATLQDKTHVKRVIAAEIAHLSIPGLQALQRQPAGAAIDEALVRGHQPKRRGLAANAFRPHTGELLIKYLEYHTSSPSRLAAAKARVEQIHGNVGAELVDVIKDPTNRRVELVKLNGNIPFESALRAYLDSEDVEYAQPNYTYKLAATPNDTYYTSGDMWHLPKISAPSLWNTTTDIRDVVVAVLDTGVAYSHIDLNDNMWINPAVGAGGYSDNLYGYNAVTQSGAPADDNGHGTHVAGIIGAEGNNSYGSVGVAWQAKIMAVKVVGSTTSPNSAALMRGINYAKFKGAKVINASLQHYPEDLAVRDAIRLFGSVGGVYVAAAGNDNNNLDLVPDYPASYLTSNEIIVGATTSSDSKASFSNFGRWSVDVFAPGDDIRSTYYPHPFDILDGTSMAAPQVAAAVAFAAIEFPWETPMELADRIRTSSDVRSINSMCFGNGRLNVSAVIGPRTVLRNLSGRSQVNTGEEIQISGFVIKGPNPKRVAFRAWGPSLTALGVQGALPDPKLTVYNASAQVIATNDNWGDLSTADKNELAAKGLTPNDPLDAAWIATVPPGAYTVHVSGVNSVTGVALVESWDIDSADVTRLANSSTRAWVGTGSSILIEGVVIGGNQPRVIYIRSLGPTLTGLGVTNALSDTVLTLYNSSGTQIASNDNWGQNGNALSKRLTEAGMAPGHSLEAAIIARLDPGNYTVHLSGKNSATGVAIVEINEF